ncbi:hypothetical protein [uncultured Ruegeria sp.]|nr:hypothetical protein [uncultured Ruegeria sp.]
MAPTHRSGSKGADAEILIHVSNATVFDLMSDNPTPDAVTHFYNVICLIGKFTERLVRSHQVASGQKRFLRWPDTLVMQALEGVCRAMEAFVEKETVLSLGMASKRGAAAYLEALAGILQRQILSSLMATTGYPGDAFAVMGSANQRWHHPARPTGAGATTRTCPDAE